MKTSLIPGAGRGLFTTVNIPSDTEICEYTGNLLRSADAVRLKDKAYLMRLGPQVYVDCGDEAAYGHVLARYINDPRRESALNVRFDKRPEEGKAIVLSTREIAAGEELYVDYGRWYWLKSPGNVLPVDGEGGASAGDAAKAAEA